MSFIRYIVSCRTVKARYERIISAIMIGQSKINTFFKRQSCSSADRVKVEGSVPEAAPECTMPRKRKRDETNSQVY